MTCRVQHRRPVHTLARTLHRARAAHAPTWMEAASGINSARCPCVVHWDARLTAADGAQPTRSHPRASTAELGPRACGSPRPRISHSPRQPLCGDDHLGKPCECHPPPSLIPLSPRQVCWSPHRSTRRRQRCMRRRCKVSTLPATRRGDLQYGCTRPCRPSAHAPAPRRDVDDLHSQYPP